MKDFLRNIVNSSDEDFSPSSTLFICNKWDVVPITDRDEVRKGIVYRLDQIYEGLRPEQIVYFSSTEVYYIIFFFDCDEYTDIREIIFNSLNWPPSNINIDVNLLTKGSDLLTYQENITTFKHGFKYIKDSKRFTIV